MRYTSSPTDPHPSSMTTSSSLTHATTVACVLSALTLGLILVVVPSLIAHINDTYALLDGEMLEFRDSTERSWEAVITTRNGRRLVKRQSNVFNNAPRAGDRGSFGAQGACQCDATPNGCPPGPPGPPGPVGMRGDDGDAGLKGKTGMASDVVLAQTDIVVEDETCFYCPHGPMGPPGAKGRSGPRGMRGARGKSGMTACDGNPGSPGSMGAPGPEGPFGNVGNPGEAGESASGIIGRPGQKGARGGKGPQGPKGLSGMSAPTAGTAGTPGKGGRPGLQGPAGMQGGAGVTGAEGESGDDAQYCSCPLRDVDFNGGGGDGRYDGGQNGGPPQQPY